MYAYLKSVANDLHFSIKLWHDCMKVVEHPVDLVTLYFAFQTEYSYQEAGRSQKFQFEREKFGNEKFCLKSKIISISKILKFQT